METTLKPVCTGPFLSFAFPWLKVSFIPKPRRVWLADKESFVRYLQMNWDLGVERWFKKNPKKKAQSPILVTDVGM